LHVRWFLLNSAAEIGEQSFFSHHPHKEEIVMMLQNEEEQPVSRFVKGNLYQISIADFKPDPAQPRKVIDSEALAELQESIRAYGILQPLLFREGEGGWSIIVSGERRYQAALALGMLVLPAICVEGSFAEIALVENLQRQDLTCIEEAEALQRLMDEAKYTQEQLAGVIGKPRSSLSDTLSLMRLPVEIRDECRGDRKAAKGLLVEISRKKQVRGMATAWSRYKEGLLKAQGGPAQVRVKRSPGASFTLAVDTLRERIRDTDTAAWSEEELAAVHTSLRLLQEEMAGFMNPAGGGEAA
jgi:ParB family chromosome partitioning protein